GVLERRGPDADLAALQALVRTHAPCGVVIGLPRRTDGSLGPEAAAIERLARRWAGALGVPVYLWDERFTTVEAERTLAEGGWPALRRRRVVDQLAAAILLQAFLERRRRTGQPPLEIRPIRADDEG
ncbi:MAG TPA: Holliday junction resolvase RuvX, partial [Limnochordia bacterium]